MLIKEETRPHLQVAAAIIIEQDRILITSRPAGSHLQGMWEFPGGKQEHGETLFQCMEREVMEELGISVRAEKEVSSVTHEYEEKIVTLHFFECTVLNGTPHGHDGQEFRWVKAEELTQYSFPPPDKEMVERLRSGELPGTYGNGIDDWEVAILDNDNKFITKDIVEDSFDDVLYEQTPKDINNIINQIQLI